MNARIAPDRAQSIDQMSPEEMKAALLAAWELNSKLTEQLEVASRCGLTKLLTRGQLDAKSEKTFRDMRDKGTNERLAVILLDIDFFKKVNDTYGHAGGDMVLQEISSVLRNDLRQADIMTAHYNRNSSPPPQGESIAGRYGGEELMIVVKVRRHEDAMRVAKRLGRKIEGHGFNHKGKSFNVTASFGVFTCVPGEQSYTLEEAVDFADQCLYKAKHGGRNRVVGMSARDFVHVAPKRAQKHKKYPVLVSRHARRLER